MLTLVFMVGVFGCAGVLGCDGSVGFLLLIESSMRIMVFLEILLLTVISSLLILLVDGDGIFIVVLLDSSVISGSFVAISSLGETSILIMGTLVKFLMFGILIFIRAAPVLGLTVG